MSEYLKQLLVTNIGSRIIDLGGRILFAIMFFLIGAQVIKLLRRLIRNAMTKGKADIGVIQFVDSFLK